MSTPQWGPEWDADGDTVSVSESDYLSPQAREYQRWQDAGESPEDAEMRAIDWENNIRIAQQMQFEGAPSAAELAEDRRHERADAELVARYLDSRQAERAARQQVGKLGDELVAASSPLRAFDRGVEEAHRTIAQVLAAEEVAAEKAEAVAMHRTAVIVRAEAREKVKGSGPAARAARDQQVLAAYDRAVHHDRVREVSARLVEVAADLGTDDPVRWQELRAAAEETLAGAEERREEVLRATIEAAAVVRERLHGAELHAAALQEERDRVAVELQERGLDPERIGEAASRVLDERPGVPAGPATEAALAQVREREVYAQRSVELDREWEQRRAEPEGRAGPAR